MLTNTPLAPTSFKFLLSLSLRGKQLQSDKAAGRWDVWERVESDQPPVQRGRRHQKDEAQVLFLGGVYGSAGGEVTQEAEPSQRGQAQGGAQSVGLRGEVSVHGFSTASAADCIPLAPLGVIAPPVGIIEHSPVIFHFGAGDPGERRALLRLRVHVRVLWSVVALQISQPLDFFDPLLFCLPHWISIAQWTQ